MMSTISISQDHALDELEDAHAYARPEEMVKQTSDQRPPTQRK